MNFEQRQALRKFRRNKHQKDNAKLMRKMGGYNSMPWRIYIQRIATKIFRQHQFIHAKIEAKRSNAA